MGLKNPNDDDNSQDINLAIAIEKSLTNTDNSQSTDNSQNSQTPDKLKFFFEQ